MPTEIVLLSDTVPASALIAELAAERHPGGVLMEYRGGTIRQCIDAAGEGVLSLFTSRPIEVTRDANDSLFDGDVGNYQFWTDLTIPYGDSTTGRALAEAIADAVGGEVRDRA